METQSHSLDQNETNEMRDTFGLDNKRISRTWEDIAKTDHRTLFITNTVTDAHVAHKTKMEHASHFIFNTIADWVGIMATCQKETTHIIDSCQFMLVKMNARVSRLYLVSKQSIRLTSRLDELEKFLAIFTSVLFRKMSKEIDLHGICIWISNAGVSSGFAFNRTILV